MYVCIHINININIDIDIDVGIIDLKRQRQRIICPICALSGAASLLLACKLSAWCQNKGTAYQLGSALHEPENCTPRQSRCAVTVSERVVSINQPDSAGCRETVQSVSLRSELKGARSKKKKKRESLTLAVTHTHSHTLAPVMPVCSPQELLHHVHDGHHIPEPDWDPHGDRLPGRPQRAGVGGLQRLLRHALPHRRGSQFPNGHHHRGLRGENGPRALFSDAIRETIIPPPSDSHIQSISAPSVIYAIHEKPG